jgi:hypothetical protein
MIWAGAWRSAKTFTKRIGIKVKQIAAQHIDKRGTALMADEFVTIKMFHSTDFPISVRPAARVSF